METVWTRLADAPVGIVYIALAVGIYMFIVGMGLSLNTFDYSRSRHQHYSVYKKHKEDWMPPGWAFGLIWAFLYHVIAWAIFLFAVGGFVIEPNGQFYERILGDITKVEYIWTFVLAVVTQMFGVMWSHLFFGMGHMLASLIVIVLMIAMNVIQIFYMGKVAAWSMISMIVYTVWLGFAAVLNLFFVMNLGIYKRPAFAKIGIIDNQGEKFEVIGLKVGEEKDQ